MRCVLLFVAVAALLHADVSQPVFATYLGGGGNEVAGPVTTDAEGNIYIAGRTDSPDFPVKNAIQPVSKSFAQIFIAKFSPAGDLLFSTYYGGTANDLATAIAVDPAGNIYVTGALQSHDFPVSNAFQPASGGAVDAFVLKLDAGFHVIYATYLGGKFNDVGMAIAVDALGNAYVTGRSESPDFPITPGAYQETIAGYQPGITSIEAFVTKLDAAGNLVYSTFLGGTQGSVGRAIAVDAGGEAIVAYEGGPGASLAKLASDGGSLIYSHVLSAPAGIQARGVTIDGNGNAYITGLTTDARMPIAGGSQHYLGGDVYLVSTDGGISFTPRRSGLAAAETTVIAFDQNAVYAGTLQGMFRSVDGGNTWTAAGLDSYSIRAMAVDASHAGIVYAATENAVFRTVDAGDTWMQLSGGRGASALAIDPNDGDTLYVVAGNNGSGIGVGQPVYRVTDLSAASGAIWTPIGQGLSTAVQALGVNPGDSALFIGTAGFTWVNQLFGGIDHIPGSVFRRMGDTWIDSGFDDNIQALAFAGNTLYAAGQKFYQSTDGGQSWISTPLPAAPARQIAIGAGDPPTIYVLNGPFPRGLLRSDDGGQSFAGVSTQPINCIAVNPADATLHAGTTASADAYVVAFDPEGTLIYSNFIGTPDVERGESIALDGSGMPYIIGFRGKGNFAVPYTGTAFIAKADGSYVADLGPTTSATVLDTPSHGITIAPDGSIVAVMIATTSGLPTENAVQSYLNGASDVYLVKFRP